MSKPKQKQKRKVRVKGSVRLKKSNSGIIGFKAPVKPIANNAAVIRVKVKKKQ